MAERIKDAEDKLLDSLFESSPVTDAGFSVAVAARVKRRLWLRRLALPVAAIIGGSIAIKPLSGLIIAARNLSSLVPEGLVSTTAGSIPPLQTIVLGAMLLAACLLGARVLQE